MKNILKTIALQCKFFASDLRGTATVEATIILPLLAAWFVGSYTFFDSFYSRNAATKASYTVGDVLSRRTDAATPAYINELGELYERLSPADGGTALRVSNIEWNGSSHVVLWSHGTNTRVVALENDDLIDNNYDERLPIMYTGETILLVEAYSAYHQPFNVGWGSSNYVFEEFVVTSPRYAAKLAWSSGGS